jgi:hypothetical protein
MKIQNYCFGKITIDNQSFTSDLLIGPDKIHPNWRRKKGHALVMADIEILLAQVMPDIFIMGTGTFGRVKIDETLEDELARRHIEFIPAKSGEAIKLYNSLSQQKRVLAGFHLTC